MAANPA
jgi:hypothetical protein